MDTWVGEAGYVEEQKEFVVEEPMVGNTQEGKDRKLNNWNPIKVKAHLAEFWE